MASSDEQQSSKPRCSWVRWVWLCRLGFSVVEGLIGAGIWGSLQFGAQASAG